LNLDAGIGRKLNLASHPFPRSVDVHTKQLFGVNTCTGIMSSSTSTSKPSENTTTAAEQPKEEDNHSHLGVLEEDDEFEEFAVAGL